MTGQDAAPYRPGDRIELVHTADPYTDLRPGDRGTVTRWNAPFHQLAVAWDSGSTLMMILEGGDDQVRLIEPAPQPRPPAGPSPTAQPPTPPTARPRRADPAPRQPAPARTFRATAAPTAAPTAGRRAPGRAHNTRPG